MASAYIWPLGAGSDKKSRKITPIPDRPREISGPRNDLLTDHLSDCDAIVVRFFVNAVPHLRGYHCLGGLYVANFRLLFEHVPDNGHHSQMIVFTGANNTSNRYLDICRDIISEGLRENRLGPVSLTCFFTGCFKFRISTSGRVTGEKRSTVAVREFFDVQLPSP